MVEIVRGTWRQDGTDVYFTNSGKEFRNRFDNAGRLVPDGRKELHKHGCKLFFERETVVKAPAPSAPPINFLTPPHS